MAPRSSGSQRYHWPGNVRELRNVITRAVALAGPDDDFQSLPFVLRPTAAAPEVATARADRPFHEAKDEVIARFEREYLTDLVQRASGNLSQAARIAGSSGSSCTSSSNVPAFVTKAERR